MTLKKCCLGLICHKKECRPPCDKDRDCQGEEYCDKDEGVCKPDCTEDRHCNQDYV